MKKLTLKLFLIVFVLGTYAGISQTLNQAASWPNAGWTLSGTYNGVGLLADPTVAASTFNWDDDGAGNGSADNLILTSPVIDLTAAQGAGETLISVSGDFVYRALGGDVLQIEVYDADAASWSTLETFVGNSTTTDYQLCAGTVAYTTAQLDISGYTATQLSGFQYRISYDDQGGWQWGWCLTSPTISSDAPITCPAVTALSIDSFNASSATISWTNGGSESNWEIVVQAAGIGIPGGAGDAISSNPHFELGLTPLTDYEVWVRADCGGGDLSDWTGPETFTTSPSVVPNCPATFTSTPSLTCGSEDTTLSWDAVVGADNYRLTIGTTMGGTDIENNLDVGNVTSFVVTGQTPGTTYYWKVGPENVVGVNTTCTEQIYTTFATGCLCDATGGLTDGTGISNVTLGIDDYPVDTNILGNYAEITAGPPVIFTQGITANVDITFNTGFTYATGIWIDFNDNLIMEAGEQVFSSPEVATPDPTVFDADFVVPGAAATGTHKMRIVTADNAANIDPCYNGDYHVTIDVDVTIQATACVPAVINSTTVIADCLTGTYSVEIDVASVGTANFITGLTPLPIAPGLNYQGPFDIGTTSPPIGTFDFTDAACNLDLGTFFSDGDAPSDLVISNVTADTADFAWTVNGSEIFWEVIAVPAGDPTPVGFGTGTGGANPYTLTGLSSETDYDGYVRSVCGGTAGIVWIGPVTFTTPCAEIVPDYFADMSVNVPDACWDEAGDGEVAAGPSGLGASDWQDDSDYALGGSNEINLFGNSDREWLLSPVFDLSGGTYQLEINVAVTDWNNGFAADTMGSDDEVQLLISDDGGASWTNLTTWNAGNQPAVGGTEYVEDLSAYTGSVQFAIFASDGTVDDAEDYDFHVGKFFVRTPPTCFEVTDITIDSVTDTEAQISWTNAGAETNWEVLVQAAGTGSPTTGTSTTNNPYTESGLSAQTDYEVYVRADCGGGDFGLWVGPVNFTTACAVEIAPYSEDFENGGTIPACWTSSSSTAQNWQFAQSPTFGNTYVDNTSGTGYFAFVDASTFPDTTTDATLTSPLVDVSGLTNPALDFFIHHFASDAGVSNLFSAEVYDGAAWNVVFTDNLGDVDGWENVLIDLSGLTITGPVQVRFIIDTDTSNNFNNDIAVDDVSFIEGPSCFDPTGLAIDSVTDTTVNASWNVDAATAWEVIVQPDGSGAPASGNAVATNSYTDNTLSASTDYELWLRNDCGGGTFSSWISIPFSTTAAPIAAFPYSEDFESGAGGWVADNSVNGVWELGAPINTIINSADSGANAWVTDLDGNYLAGDNSNVMSPPFDMSGLANPVIELSVWYNSEFSWDGMVLQSSIDGGTSWQNVGAFGDPNNWYNDDSVNGTDAWTGRNSTGNGSAGWLQASNSLVGLGGESSVILRLLFTSDGSGQDEGVAFDTVNIFDPLCPDVTGITIDSVTADSAQISWTSSETNFEVEVQAPGGGEPAGSGTATTDNPYTESGLTEQTDYEVYVRVDCGGGTFGNWVGPVAFTTACAVQTLPYSEDFENAGVIPDCWTSSSSTARVWQFATTPTFGNTYGDNTTGTGFFAFVDASTFPDTTTDATLTSPSIDVSGLTSPALNFYLHHFTSDAGISNLFSAEVYDGAAWNVVYTDNDGDLDGWENVLVDLSGLTITGPVQVRFIIDTDTSNNFNNDIAVDDVSFIELPSCFDPSGITVTNITETTADISWTPGATETDWEVLVQAAGTGSPSGGTATTLNPYTETGLTAQTAYEVYVRADCGGDFSEWVGPINFSTACSAFAVPFNETFDSTSTTEDCWTVLNENADGDAWDLDYTTDVISGDENAALNTDFNGGNNDDWLISPTITLTGNERLIFRYSLQSTFEPNDFEVLLSTTGTAPAAFTNTLLALDSYDDVDVDLGESTELTIELTSYSGDVNIAWHVPSGGLDGWRLFIDDVLIEELPACPDISDLVVSNITTTTADIGWTVGDTETDWEVAVQAPGTGIPAGMGTQTTDNPYTAPGLTAQTDYEVYVRSDCGGGDLGNWIGPVNFTTACNTFALPLLEDFEGNGDAIPDCWSQEYEVNAVDWRFDNDGDNGGDGAGTADSALSGTRNAMFVDASGADDITKLVSPPLDLSGTSSPELVFYHAQQEWAGDQDELRVYYRTSAGGAWVEIASYTNDIDDWTQEVLALPNPSSDYYIAFEGNAKFGRGVVIDDVLIWDNAPGTYTYTDGVWSPFTPPGNDLDDIIVASGELQFSSDFTCNSMIVNPGGGVVVDNGVTLEATNGLLLESSSTSYSSLIRNGAVTGTITYERHVNINGSGTTGSNDLISAPLTGQPFDQFRAANPNIFSNGDGTLFLFGPFTKGNGTYVTWDDTVTTPLAPGVGYRAATDDNGSFTFVGTDNNGVITNDIQNAGINNPEWNLVGNPYPSYLNVQAFLLEDVGGVVNLNLFDGPTAAIYGYDGSALNGWTLYNLATTTASTVIAPGQGFMVSADATNDDLYDLEFTPAMRRTGNTDDFIVGRETALTYLTLNLTSANNGYSTDFYFNAKASQGFDKGYDAAIWGETAPAFSIYSSLVQDDLGAPMTLQALRDTDLDNVTIPLGVNASQGEQITFSIGESTLPAHVKVYLDDTVENTTTLLNASDYVMTPKGDLSGTGRFFLRYEEDASLIENSLDALDIFTLNESDELVVSGELVENATLNLFDIQGRQVLTVKLDSELVQNRINVANINAGIYLATVSNNNQEVTKKVIIE